MSKQNSIPLLFRSWREGDAQAGQEMAQRLSDWYYAIAVNRLGELEAREPLKRACDAFAQGVTQVDRSSKLVDWAHGLIDAETARAGERVAGADLPNALTGKRPPSELLEGAWDELPREELLLLSHAYTTPLPDLPVLQREAEAQGGFPFAILRARLHLKRWLKERRGVNFQVLPEQPDPDESPLPLYEAGLLASAEEERTFERWMLERFRLCRDVAEFSTFAHALRAGALGLPPARPRREEQPAPGASPGPDGSSPEVPEKPPAPAERGESPAPPARTEPPAPRKSSAAWWVAAFLAVVVVILLVLLVLRG